MNRPNTDASNERSSATSGVAKIAKTGGAAFLAAVALAASSGAFASELSDQRGYNSCVKAFDAPELTGVTFPRQYFLDSNADSNTYYLNASVWESGNRVTKRITCETTKNGRDLLAFETADGRFALSSSDPISVAER